MPRKPRRKCKLCRAKIHGWRLCPGCRVREAEVRRAISAALRERPAAPYSPRVVRVLVGGC